VGAPVKGNLIKYYYKALNTPSLYNGVQVIRKSMTQDFTAADFKIPTISEYEKASLDEVIRT